MTTTREPPTTVALPTTNIAPTDRPWTIDDLLQQAADGHTYELVDGELQQMSPASHTHGDLEFRLAVAIGKYLEANPIGKGYTGDTGFQIRSEPLTIRVPDVAFVANERIPTGELPPFLPLAPDLVIEIVSPSETAPMIAGKLADYLAAGTRLLWVFYPSLALVFEYRVANAFRIYRTGEALEGYDVLPGFSLPLATLWQ